MSTAAADIVDLTSPDLWARTDLPALIDDLRATDPVHHMVSAHDGPLWSVLSHSVGSQVLTDATRFSSEGGSLLLGYDAEKVPAGAGTMMALSDPPKHREFRAPALPFFARKGVDDISQHVVDLAGSTMDRALESGEVDLVDVFSVVPLVVMCDVLDIPEQDREMVVRMCDQAFLGRTSDERRTGHRGLLPYLFQLAVDRRQRPGNDLISRMATHLDRGKPMPIEEVVLNLDNIVVGGVQTVRHTAAMSTWALMNHPDRWRQIETGEMPMGSSVDELLRWTSVGLHVLRTASRDVELAGRQIARGARVAVWTWAANRDPVMFERPHEIILDRAPNKHLAFGLGPHYCIGVRLAKVELEAMLGALFARVAEVEPTAPPQHNRSIINFGFDHFPVRLHAR